MAESANPTCVHCNRLITSEEAVRVGWLRPSLAGLVQSQHPSAGPDDCLCFRCLDDFRVLLIEQTFTRERGELRDLERSVVEALHRHELLAEDVNRHFSERLSFGQRLADRVASFGGSWAFIVLFAGMIGVWICLNSLIGQNQRFDPFPFILLNLVLSCVAAMQAPVIMMSQNRQEAKDRIRAESDYVTNLKAEFEVRQLHEKLDHLLNRQMADLMEVQHVQIEMLREITESRRH